MGQKSRTAAREQKPLEVLVDLEDEITGCFEALAEHERNIVKGGFGGEILRVGHSKMRLRLNALRDKTAMLHRFFNDGK